MKRPPGSNFSDCATGSKASRGIHFKPAGEGRDGRGRAFVEHDEVAAAPAQRVAQLGHGCVDESHAPVGARQPVEDRAVEDEGAVHALRRPERLEKPGVVLVAQVAAEPEKRGSVHRHGQEPPGTI